MKNFYKSPLLELILIGADDFLTLSDDNDAPFIPPVSGDGSNNGDDGWSGYH